ncbi:MAG: hypothetical protein K0R34_3684 [Herbinix sp.]|jgi:hypothetical protein|nr:hypothetical protein [Herbinix sp.]
MSEKHYLVCGHTAKGYVNLFRSNLEPLSKVYILMGGPGTGKLNFMKRIASRLDELEETVEYLHSPSDPEALDGVLFPELDIGIVNGASHHVIETRAPGAIEEYINLGEAWDTSKLALHTEQILELNVNMQRNYEKAYAAFANGLKVHDEWEKIYIGNMNFEKANELTAFLIPTLFGDIKLEKAACVKHRFFGGSTPYGPMDFVDDISAELATRYFIKGRPGSGKSTMLKKILEAAKSQGLDTEVYHCGFDPDSLDMLLFPELSLCIFDSTSPHEYYPNREGDTVIDMYAELITEGTDELYTEEIADILTRYKSHTKEGCAYLAAAKVYMEELEQLYHDATDLEVIDRKYNELYNKIMNSRPSV